MSWQLWLIIILAAVGASFGMFGLGLVEKDAKYRFLAILAVGPIAAASILGCLAVYMRWPNALGLLAGIGILVVGGVVISGCVSRILPKKIDPYNEMR